MFAQFAEAGLSLAAALEGEAALPLPAPVVAALRAGLREGEPLSGLLAGLGLVDEAGAALLEAGERLGGIPAALRRLAQRLSEQEAARRAFLGSLLRPAGLLLAAGVILPLPLLFTAGTGAYLARALPLVALVAVAALLLLGVWPRLPPDAAPRRRLLQAGLALPGLRAPLHHAAWATFAEVLGATLGAGLPARESLQLAARATPHPEFRAAAGELAARLDGGATLAEATAPLLLPRAFVAQLAAAEQSGSLDLALARLAAGHREEERRTTAQATAVAGGAIFACVAAVAALSIVQGFSDAVGGRSRALEQILTP